MAAKTERLRVLITPTAKKRIELAAAVEETSIADFCRRVLDREAREVLSDRISSVIVNRFRDSETVVVHVTGAGTGPARESDAGT